MGKWMSVAWCGVGLLALWGCGGPVISKELRAQAVPITGLSEVRQDPQGFKNRTIIVGGRIINTINHAKETTTLIVLDLPLGHRERPEESANSQGRFLVQVSRFLDPEVFAKDRYVTVAGVVEGERTAPVGKTEYTYVVIKARQVYLWQPKRHTYAYPYYPYGGYGYRGPWWGPGFDEEEGFEGREGFGEGGERGGEGGRR